MIQFGEFAQDEVCDIVKSFNQLIAKRSNLIVYMETSQWQLLPAVTEEYLNASGVPPLIAQLLYNRGIKLDEIALFLAADSRFASSPFLLSDMSHAVSRIYKALLAGEKIAVYGDFDVDGITATIVLMEGLSRIGGRAIPYIPERHGEGHGLHLGAIEKLHSQGVGLIITVDCGITACEPVKMAQQLGIDVVITDHHIPPQELPQAIAVINPKRANSRYPFLELAGVGVAFKLVQALLYKHSKEASLNEFLDLVALGTVTDLVPLLNENRYLVKQGIEVLNNTNRIGLKEMINLVGLKMGQIGNEEISWTLGPRLNAAGRMNNASTSYELLVTQSSEEAYRLARELEVKNAERQRLTDEVLRGVKEKLVSHAYPPLLIEGDESYPLGIIGLVAGRLVDKFYKPAIILNLDTEICRGSCRSIPEFNIVSALEKCHDLLISFGGHPAAAGFTLARQNLPKFEERILKLATDELEHLHLVPKINIDAEVPLSIFIGDTFNLIEKVAPFGRGNPLPTFLTRRLEIVEHRNLGNEGKHLELKVKQGNVIWKAIAFNSGKPQEKFPPYIDAVYNMGKTWWNGQEVLRLNLLDFTPST